MNNIKLCHAATEAARNLVTLAANRTSVWLDRQQANMVLDRVEDAYAWSKRRDKLIAKCGGEEKLSDLLTAYDAAIAIARQ